MKTIKIQIVVFCIVLFVCGSFINIQNREEELKKLNPNNAVISDKCFDTFLKNLTSLGAIIYIPDSKLLKGKELGLSPVLKSSDNTEAVDMFSLLDQVGPVTTPGDECSGSVSLTFKDIEMLVFIDKTKSENYSKLGLTKINDQRFKIEGKFFKFENLKFKLNEKEVKYVPVQTNLIVK